MPTDEQPDGQPDGQPDERPDEPHGIRRRTLLGAVLGAGAASGFATHELTDRSNSSKPTGPGSGGDASAVKVQPTGELIAEDVQDALVDVYERTSAQSRLEDLQVAYEIVDDFPPRAGGQIGGAGWFADAAGDGAGTGSASPAEGGVVRLTTGTRPDGRSGIHLGLDQHQGTPLFTLEWRVRPDQTATPADGFTLRFGALDSVSSGSGGRPRHGLYFEYDPPAHGPQWHCVCANSQGRTAVDARRRPDLEFHRFRITADGAGLARFYVDDDLVASVSTHLPLDTDRYGHGIEIAKLTGSKPVGASADWFYLRRELPR